MYFFDTNYTRIGSDSGYYLVINNNKEEKEEHKKTATIFDAIIKFI